MTPNARTLVELVRLPAVLSVPGDVLAGAALASEPGDRPHVALLAASSSLLYLAGMALNDYADRDVDATERPHRPIPSGRVEPGFALGLASALTVAGLGLATLARRPPKATLALTASVWAYDLVAKGGKAGPLTMASARTLDVLAGAPAGRSRRALPFALVMGAHTLMVTSVSASEVHGGSSELAKGASGITTIVSASTVAIGLGRVWRGGRSPLSAALTVGLVGVHAGTVVRAQQAAADLPSARNFGRVVGAGILGMLPLQGAILAGTGRPRIAAALGALWPVAKRLSQKAAVT